VFEHIDMLSTGIGLQQHYYPVLPTVIVSDFGVLGHLWLWSQNDGIVSWLRLTDTSNCLIHSSKTWKSVWVHWYAVHRPMV